MTTRTYYRVVFTYPLLPNFLEAAMPVARNNRSLLINQLMFSASFYDGSSPDSITNVITSEIESARSLVVEQ
eukprot:scaffold91661_cov75-Cyclotella_meneghiniana.AAC.1